MPLAPSSTPRLASSGRQTPFRMTGSGVESRSHSKSFHVRLASMVHESASWIPLPVWPVGPPGRSR